MKFAFRQLLKNPGFTAVAVLSLALGIGATTALFSVVYGVLISPYPYKDPDKIWTPGIQALKDGDRRGSYRPAEYFEMTKVASFADVMATSPDTILLTGEFAPETVRGVRVTGNAFQFLGVPPVIGRGLLPTDISTTGEPEPVVVLSYQFWQRLLGGDANAIGKTLRLNDKVHTIVGVMPPRFGWWTSDGVWLPLALDRREDRWFNPIIRLKPGVTQLAAEQDLHRLHQSLAKDNPSSFPKDGFRTKLTNYMDVTVASDEMQKTLYLLFGAVAFLLLIACANVANLQLARGTSRVREMAIRLSVGARRGRLVGQLLTESVLLSMIGGVLGLIFAYWTTKLMVQLMPTFYVPNEARIQINTWVLCFCLIVSMLTGILFGLAPALQSSQVDLTEALKDTAKGSGTSSRGSRTRKLLVIGEVALSVVLLISAGLTIRTFLALQQINPGFRPENVITLGLPLPPKRYSTLEQRNRFAHDLLERIQNIPGVQAASMGNGGTPFGGPDSSFGIEGQPDLETRRITLNLISANYLRTLGVPLRRGRMPTEREISNGEHLAVINETAAAFWPPGQDPIGKHIFLDTLEKPGSASVLKPEGSLGGAIVIGVIGDVRNDGLRNKSQPVVLVPYTLLAPPQRTIAVRYQGDSTVVINSLRTQTRELDKEQPLGSPRSMEEVLGFQTVQPRFMMALFAFFAALGLILATAGIYSVLSYMVTQRTHEIGVRMALGAQWTDVLRLILSAGGKLVFAGIFIGLLAGFGVTRLLATQLYGVSPIDPISYFAVILVLSVVGLAACYIPARRATRVNPIQALRYE